MRVRTFRVLSSSRLGFRGAVLFILAMFDLAYGLSFLTPDADTGTATAHWRESFMPLWAWGLMWLAAGTTAAVYSFSRRDEIGYAVQCTWLTGWCVISFLSSALGEVDRGWVSGVLFLAPLGISLVCSGWPEPPKIDTVTAMEVEPGDAEGGQL